MIEFFRSVLVSIESVLKFITMPFQYLAKLFQMIISVIASIGTLVLQIPVSLQVFALAAIFIAVVYVIVGR